MVYIRNIKEIFIVALFIIQIVNTSPPRMCFCPKCSCSKDNFYNTFSPPFSCTNYQNYQNSILYPSAPCSNCNEQNAADACCYPMPPSNIGSPGDCNACTGFSFDTQIPSIEPPAPRYSYPYAADTPPIPCAQTLKHFDYQLQVPAIPGSEPKYGSLNGIVDKTYKKCTACCKPRY